MNEEYIKKIVKNEINNTHFINSLFTSIYLITEINRICDSRIYNITRDIHRTLSDYYLYNTQLKEITDKINKNYENKLIKYSSVSFLKYKTNIDLYFEEKMETIINSPNLEIITKYHVEKIKKDIEHQNFYCFGLLFAFNFALGSYIIIKNT